MLHDLQANKLAQHSFMGAGRGQEAPGSKAWTRGEASKSQSCSCQDTLPTPNPQVLLCN